MRCFQLRIGVSRNVNLCSFSDCFGVIENFRTLDFAFVSVWTTLINFLLRNERCGLLGLAR